MNKVTLDYGGQELTAEKQADDNWLVTLGGRESRARYLDYALVELLGIPSGQAIPLATKIVEQLPPD